jgi:hypothetical protein
MNRIRGTAVAVVVLLALGGAAIPVVQATQRSEARARQRSLDRTELAAVKVIQASTSTGWTTSSATRWSR